MIPLTENKNMLGYESLSGFPGVFHFVTTRCGGYGEGNYGTFNCSPYAGDDPDAVRRNQAVLLSAAHYPVRELIIPRQTHGIVCHTITEDYLTFSTERRKALIDGVDALITAVPGFCICVSTADCVPLLLYDRHHQVVAAIHAGWRGTVGRILHFTLKRMSMDFGVKGEDLLACIGPSISPEAFEVGDEVFDAFYKEGFDMPHLSFRNPRTGKWHIDLWEANRMLLFDFGVPQNQIEVAGLCTYFNNDRFFSARKQGINSGRMLSGIMLY